VANIADLRTAIATNLGSIAGLRVSSFIPDNPSPPIAIVQFDRAEYHLDMANGMSEYNFIIQLIVGRVDERTAQRNLDSYCASTGAASVLLAVESDRTLGSKAFDCIVTQMSSYGPVSVNDVVYLGAEFQVRVLAS
jgi:hypothetical protein